MRLLWWNSNTPGPGFAASKYVPFKIVPLADLRSTTRSTVFVRASEIIRSDPRTSGISSNGVCFMAVSTLFFSRQCPRYAETHDVSAEVGGIALSRRPSQPPRRKPPGDDALHSEALALAVVRVDIARGSLVRAPVRGNARVAVFV